LVVLFSDAAACEARVYIGDVVGKSMLEFGRCQDGSHITARTLLPLSSLHPSTCIIVSIRSIYIAAPPAA
jgi:hypothetical protein